MRPLILATALATLLMLLPIEDVRLLHLAPAMRSELQNFAHPVVFATLAVLGMRAIRQTTGTLRTVPQLLLAGVLVVFAAFTEMLQGLTGREQSFGDFIGDLLGISAGMFWGLRGSLALWVANLAALAASAPLLWTVSAYLYRQARTPLIWQIDSALLNRFSHWQEGEYPGLVIEEVPADWRDYQTLAITVRNPGADVASFSVRIHDLAHDHRYDDRYNRHFLLPANSTEVVRIPLSEVATAPGGRSLDLAAVAGLIVFQEAAGPRVLPIEIRLDQTYLVDLSDSSAGLSASSDSL
jgi:hypothetical protein